MMAYISLEYSTDGSSPSQVDQVLHRIGLRRRGTHYLLEAPSEGSLHQELDRLHAALAGTGARYRVSLERPDRGSQEGKAREEALKMVDVGLIDESVVELLDSDHYEFKQKALLSTEAVLDRIIDMHIREEQRRKDDQRREAVKEEITILLRAGGGKHFQEIAGGFDLDEMVMSDILDEMVEDGTVTARQVENRIIYVLSGPVLRSLSR